MPLEVMSPPNTLELDAQPRKRSHEDFSEDIQHLNDENAQSPSKKQATAKPPQTTPSIASTTSAKSSIPSGSPTPMDLDTSTSPAQPSLGGGSVNGTGTRTSASPNSAQGQTRTTTIPVPPADITIKDDKQSSTAANGQPTSQPTGPVALHSATKKSRSKLTPAEKAAKAKEAEEQKAKREADKKAKADVKAAEDARKEADKRAKAEAKEAQRKEKAEAKEKAKEKAEAEKAAKKRQKEEEERKAREEKERKARAQPSIASFFGGAKSSLVTTPKKGTSMAHSIGTPASATSGKATPTKPESEKTEYERLKFNSFFLAEHVTLAVEQFTMDDETREAKSRILDEYLSGARGEPKLTPFNPIETFCLIGPSKRRGRAHPSVKKLMEELYETSGSSFSAPIDLTGTKKAPSEALTDTLKTIPYKFIGFRENVRPPYRGTITSEPVSTLRNLARKPTSRSLAQLDYDFDSEGEWFDDGEGDDLDDATDDEDEVEAEDDMAGFLDDEDDVLLGRLRMPYSGDLQPESTGICFENQKRQGPDPTVYKHRLEFILPMDSHHGIDPFSTAYWKKESKAPTNSSGDKPNAATSSTTTHSTTVAEKKPDDEATAILKGLPDATLDKIKSGILRYNHVNKTGLVNCLASEVAGVSAKKLTKILALVADQSGPPAKKAKRTWQLRPGYAVPGQSGS